MTKISNAEKESRRLRLAVAKSSKHKVTGHGCVIEEKSPSQWIVHLDDEVTFQWWPSTSKVRLHNNITQSMSLAGVIQYVRSYMREKRRETNDI